MPLCITFALPVRFKPHDPGAVVGLLVDVRRGAVEAAREPVAAGEDPARRALARHAEAGSRVGGGRHGEGRQEGEGDEGGTAEWHAGMVPTRARGRAAGYPRSMPELRSRTVTHGRNMAGARALLRAAGVEREDFGKPIVAVANCYTQFVPGHTHLQPVGEIVADGVHAAGGIPREFNTIAVDDGIAMGHGGMLYSLPSRDLIADSVEYMVNAHCADALVCISNCDKITPGMLNAALRLNIPTVFVSGGPMEGGTATLVDGTVRKRVNLITRDRRRRRRRGLRRGHRAHRGGRLPDVRLLLGHVHRQLDELPDRGARAGAARQRLDPRDAHRAQASSTRTPAAPSSRSPRRYYDEDDARVLPRAIATRDAFDNAMTLDIAMGGSTNTVLHLLAAAQEAEIDFTMADIDELSRRVPCLCKVAPNGTYLMEDVHRAGGIPAILGELRRGGLLQRGRRRRSTRARWTSGSATGTCAAAAASEEARRAVPRRARLRALGDRVLAVRALGVARPRRRRRLHPRRRARLLGRRRPGDPLRQPRRATAAW